jgi:hypothetical protein
VSSPLDDRNHSRMIAMAAAGQAVSCTGFYCSGSMRALAWRLGSSRRSCVRSRRSVPRGNSDASRNNACTSSPRARRKKVRGAIWSALERFGLVKRTRGGHPSRPSSVTPQARDSSHRPILLYASRHIAPAPLKHKPQRACREERRYWPLQRSP